ncbi:MAG: NAD(P)H-binding protein [Pseudomonadota bacterium]|nr:NAD(P)H-binding protein [Pseudomonadota bacterium]
MRVMLLGASGTIGLATASALMRQGHDVVCFLRKPKTTVAANDASNLKQHLSGATLRFGDPCSLESLRLDGFCHESFDAVVSCMASRTGTPRDAWAVDHQAHLHVLQAAKEVGVQYFVQLSAICVQKPLLAFQQAKLAFEKKLMASGLTYAIVRPTAFFKSLSGQLARVQKGKPFLMFGDGKLTSCKPISDDDLGDFIASCLTDSSKHNQILPIGGPGPAITPLEQGEYLFKQLNRPPQFKRVPVKLLDVIIGVLNLIGKVFPAAADKAELARIGRYYATESMLVWNASLQQYDAEATPSHGRQTLFDAYASWLQGDALPNRREHSVF